MNRYKYTMKHVFVHAHVLFMRLKCVQPQNADRKALECPIFSIHSRGTENNERFTYLIIYIERDEQKVLMYACT